MNLTNPNVKVALWWVGLIIVALLGAYLPLLISLLIGCAYGFLTAQVGWWAFPFMYQKRI